MPEVFLSNTNNICVALFDKRDTIKLESSNCLWLIGEKNHVEFKKIFKRPDPLGGGFPRFLRVL